MHVNVIAIDDYWMVIGTAEVDGVGWCEFVDCVVGCRAQHVFRMTTRVATVFTFGVLTNVGDGNHMCQLNKYRCR